MINTYLIFIILVIVSTPSGSLPHVPPLHASRTTTSKRRRESKINMLLRIKTNNETRNVNNLFPNPKRRDRER